MRSNRAASRLLGTFLDKLQVGVAANRSLFVAVTCGTAAWFAVLEASIESRWAAGSMRKPALKPLSDTDIRDGITAAKRDSAKADQFAGLLLDENLRSVASRRHLRQLVG